MTTRRFGRNEIRIAVGICAVLALEWYGRFIDNRSRAEETKQEAEARLIANAEFVSDSIRELQTLIDHEVLKTSEHLLRLDELDEQVQVIASLTGVTASILAGTEPDSVVAKGLVRFVYRVHAKGELDNVLVFISRLENTPLRSTAREIGLERVEAEPGSVTASVLFATHARSQTIRTKHSGEAGQ